MVSVRRGEPRDLSQLLAFDTLCGERIAEILENRMMVAETSGAIAGYVSWQNGGLAGRDYINKLVTADPYRRKGIASLLIASLRNVICGRVFISAGISNNAAIRMLNRTGWERVGELSGIGHAGEPEAFFSIDLGDRRGVT